MKYLRSLCLLLAAGAFLLTACETEEDPTTDQPGGQEQPEDPDKPGTPGQPAAPDFTPEAWYKTNYWLRTDREKEGLRGPVKQWHETTYVSYTLYEYDQAGHLLKESTYNNSGNLSSVTEYTYDGEGRRTRSVCSDGAGYLFEERTYEYGNPGKYVCAETYLYHDAVLVGLSGRSEAIIPGLSFMRINTPNDAQHDRFTECTYTFDSDGNLSIRDYRYWVDKWDGNKIMEDTVTDYTYRWIYKDGYPYATAPENPSDYAVTSMTWQSNGMPLTWDCKIKENTYTWLGEYRINHCEWFENDRVLDFKDYTHVAGYVGSWLADYWRKKEFDEHQELTHMQFDVYNEGQHFDYYYTDYEYDSHGNWISRKEDTTGILDGNQSITKATREIVYY